ncbi:uncharacterized protein CEXT_121491 [Caerostris extrusa]|uniref:Uncharacterized protein n=1 Tax=Caerostris extrusa TaxID=172846 RepID=A0AAV4RN36_CAEEX|nr:uncharacterized protein CEXT_121491 [Caerostris extrusa]
MDKGIQTTRHRLSEIYSVPLDEVISFNLFWDNFGEVNISLLKNIIHNTPTATTVLKEKESMTLTSIFKKLLTYNLLSSKLFIRSFNNNTTIMRASKYAFAIANSVSDVIKSTSVSTELIQAFDISFFRLQRHTSTGTYASIFSSIISDIFNQKNILTSTKLQPLSINVSYAINSALFSVSSMKNFRGKFFSKKELKMKLLLHQLKLPLECSESRLHAIKMAEILKSQLKIDMEPFQSLIESYNAVLSSLHKRSDVEQGILEIASITSGMLKNLNFTDPSEVISQAVVTSNKLNSAISENQLARKIASATTEILSKQRLLNTSRLVTQAAFTSNIMIKSIANAFEVCSNDGSRVKKVETSILGDETFNKSLYYNLQTQTPLGFFLQNASHNEVTVLIKAMLKFLISALKKTPSQDDDELLHSTLYEMFLKEKAENHSNVNEAIVSSVIASFLKQKTI